MGKWGIPDSVWRVIGSEAASAASAIVAKKTGKGKEPDIDPQIEQRLRVIAENQQAQLIILSRLEKYMNASLERLTREVAETKDAVNTAIALIGKLAGAIPPEALEALSASLDDDQTRLLAAVQAANETPGDPAPGGGNEA